MSSSEYARLPQGWRAAAAGVTAHRLAMPRVAAATPAAEVARRGPVLRDRSFGDA